MAETPTFATGDTPLKVPVETVVSLFKMLSETPGRLDQFKAAVPGSFVSVDPKTINAVKQFLFDQNLQDRFPAARSMMGLREDDCPGHECPHIDH